MLKLSISCLIIGFALSYAYPADKDNVVTSSPAAAIVAGDHARPVEYPKYPPNHPDFHKLGPWKNGPPSVEDKDKKFADEDKEELEKSEFGWGWRHYGNWGGWNDYGWGGPVYYRRYYYPSYWW